MKRPSKMNLQEYVEAKRSKTIAVYKADSGLIAEHHGIELEMLAGGYGYRQVLELVQNGADAQLEQRKTRRSSKNRHRIEVRLCDSRLYVANTGEPLTQKGVDALLGSHVSPKRGKEIGRFGLGFKSLLGLGGRIDVFTRSSGAIRFDPERCRSELKKKFRVAEAPALRLAWPLDDKEYDDPIVAEMRRRRAETIVRAEIRNTDIEQHLREEICRFPAEFLLFFPVNVQIFLNDDTDQPRELRLERDGDACVLHDGDSTSTWLVATKSDVNITDQRALDDATEIHRREAVPISWAVPLDSAKKDAGTFWAFFPTSTQTRLAGILNAPWKLNSDRTAIIRGEWNSALMCEAAKLVVETLRKLSTPDDPGQPLDAFPRQLDRHDEIAEPLVNAVWRELETRAVIPDGSGKKLRRASDLRRPPRSNAELARLWEAIACRQELVKVVHSSCLDGDRRSRLDALADRIAPMPWSNANAPRLRRFEAAEWFDCIASNDLEIAARVLELVKMFKEDCRPAEWEQHRASLRIIPSVDHRLLTADEASLAPDGAAFPGRTPVAGALRDDLDAVRILVEVMKVIEPDDKFWQTELSRALDNATKAEGRQQKDVAWLAFWQLLRSAPDSLRAGFIDRNFIRVRRRDGTWTWPDAALMPGGLVDERDSSSNTNVLVDLVAHADDKALLKRLGAVSRPEGIIDADCDEWALVRWRSWCRDSYKRQHPNGARKTRLCASIFSMPSGWTLLPELRGSANAQLAQIFLSLLDRNEFSRDIDFGHDTNTEYATIPIAHPLPWFLITYGTVFIRDASVALRAVVSRRHCPAVAASAELQWLLPHLEALADAKPAPSGSQGQIGEFWHALIDELAVSAALTDGSLRDLWYDAAKDGVVPDTLRIEGADVPLDEMYVTNSTDLALRASKAGYVAVTLNRETFDIWLEHGAMDLSLHVKPEWAEQFDPSRLLDSFPELGAVGIFRQDAAAEAPCLRVSRLRLRIGDSLEPLPCLLWDGALLVDNEQLQALSRQARLTLLLEAAGAADWLQCSPAQASEKLGDSQVEERREKVAAARSLEDRLLCAVGGRTEPLRQALGDIGAADFVEQCEPLQLAKLVLAQLGPAALSALKDALDEEGLKPPSRWGSAEAREFVAAIGFPDTFAASPGARRDAEEMISGPIKLGPLHSFQEDVLKSIGELMASGRGRRRAVISLPTGAGKTRVTVQAAVKLVLKPEGERRSVLWIAQTDELCEQAVQAFRQVWLNLGAKKTDLRIVRLWSGNPNPVVRESGKPIVVVASIQTLNSRMGDDPLAWLQKPGLVVVDECHHGITPSYTRLLHWLDADSTRKESARDDEPPILGLSATPFRTDDDESARLAKRFDSRWFPADQEDLRARLQAEGYLAIPEYVPLESGVNLLPEEIEQLSRLPQPWSGVEFENILEAINQRLASSEERNEKLVDYLLECDERSILFFSNSVEHASEISARLNLASMTAAPVSGKTPSAARRDFLDRFQRGEIRVLCNHTVLSTGFDAPKTDMVLIARQVFSAVRYMQMVGRGLRGEKNGGKQRCRIVTVLDNLGRFEDLHPYHYCRRHFGDGRG